MLFSSASAPRAAAESEPVPSPCDARTRFLEHRGRRVVLADYSGMYDPASIVAEVQRMGQLVQGQPAASALVLTDVRGARYSWTVLVALREMMRANAPHVRHSAAVLDAPLRAAFDTLLVMTGRTVRAFATRDEALDWLVEQG
jgi:hypothetical protein